jgi:hypothetical protein
MRAAIHLDENGRIPMEQNEFTVHLTQTTSSKQLVDEVMREKGRNYITFLLCCAL